MRCNCLLIGTFLVLLFPSFLYSQVESQWLNSNLQKASVDETIFAIEQDLSLQVLLDEVTMEELKLPEIVDSMELSDYMKGISKLNSCAVFFVKPNYLIVSSTVKDVFNIESDYFPTYEVIKKQESLESESDFLSTQNDYASQVFIIGNPTPQRSTRTETFAGKVFSNSDDLPIIGATVFVKELEKGAYTDENGDFSIKLKPGTYTILLKSLNHREEKIQINLYDSGSMDFTMTTQDEMLDNIVITSKRADIMRNTQMGVEKLKANAIKQIPLVMGENDILKVFGLLPGVQTVGEGSAGFNVRGSPADQNLFYIDGIPLYSTSHLFGFFSAFNSDAVDEFALYKSHMPAKYGGRLASIFDIDARSGSKKSFKFNGGVSPVSARIVVEGPIIKEKLSFLASARTTYSNYILRQISNPDFNQSNVFFGDGSLKLDYKVNKKNSIKGFLYYSLDDIDFAKQADFKNENQGASLQWNHRFTERHQSDLSLVHSQFLLDVNNKQSVFNDYNQVSGIAHTELRYEGHWLVSDRHNLLYGFDTKYYDVNEGFIKPISEQSQVSGVEFGSEQGWESGIFLGDEIKVTDRFDIDAGLRFNYYQFLGPNTVNSYAENVEKQASSIIDTKSYEAGERIEDYSGLDYRLALKYAVTPSLTLKASFNTMHQYLFLLSNTIALSPNDRWKLTDNNIEPMQSQQLSLGAYTKLFNKNLDISVETYYKQIQNLIEFKDGANLLVNEFPEQDVLPGNLDAYGVEFTIKKPRGKLNGWINYVYSSSTILVDNAYDGGQINFGERYRSNFDKPHAFNLVMNYKARKRISFSSNVVYATGRPITYPTVVYEQSEIPLINFTSRNASRIPDYFRMDLSMNIEGNLKSKKLLHGSWAFSVYNLTGRRNAYNVFFQNVGNNVLGYRVSIFARPIFSISYNFKFGNFDN